jgi:putative ABC transport system substrate-binding protein
VTTAAAQNVTRTIPIVMTAATDPVASGVVASLARPGGNVTGISSTLVEVSVKRIELVKELLPSADRLAVVRWRYEIVGPSEMQTLERTAQRLGMGFKSFLAEDDADFKRVFVDIQKERFSAAIDLAGLAISFPFTSLLPELALRHKIPMVHFLHELVERGGLISYGASVTDGFRRSAHFVDRIAKGARPGELPVEQASSLELWVNQATARALGVKVADSILVRADRIVG